MPHRTNDSLLRPRTPAPTRAKDPLVRELGPDPLVRDYERGPFPAVVVPAFPPGAVALMERLTGRPFDPALMATWERVRAYMAYPGVEVTPQLALATRAAPDPQRDHRSPAAAPKPGPSTGPTAPAVRPGSFDPRDLGD